MKTSIVILNWNGKDFLRKFLPILIKNTKCSDVDIIVADNGSTDDSVKVLQTEFSQIRTILLDKNYGFAEGYNKALCQVDAEYYVLLNSDVEVSAEWLEPLVQYMDEHIEVSACQPKILSYTRRECFEYAGASGGFIDSYGFPFCRGRILATVEADNAQYDNIIDVFWATGACLFVRSKHYWEVGGLDEKFFAHMEEIDLCWRLRSRGHRIVCIPQSTVYHVGGGTLNSEHPYKTYLNHRNSLLTLYKNLPEKMLCKTMFVRYFFDYLAALQYFVTGKFKSAKSVFKARRDYKKMRSSYSEHRKENLAKATAINIFEIFQGSIVFQYYLKGKKTFNQLYNKN